jgi:arylsulfatase A-like enzyme/Tfp pilus assembly protein PilF
LILITADTLRADKLGCYGNDSVATPNIDRLAASGVLFENAATVTPLTLPAHSSIFTGTYPTFHGVRDNGGYYLGAEQTTLAEVLKKEGWATGAFVGAFVLDSRWGLDQGFDHYFDDFDFSEFDDISLGSVERRGDQVLNEAIGWMGSVQRRPFFSWIHLFDPHAPYDPPEPYRSRYGTGAEGRYDGEVAFVDDLVGRLTSWIQRVGLKKRTIVVFIGDHGEGLGQHGEAEHGFFIYDSTMRIPFILSSPYHELEPRRVAAQVSAVDLMPTLLDLLDIPQPPSVQGQSLRAVAASGERDPELIAYGESFYPRHHYGWSELQSLRNGELHFIAAPEPEVYDFRNDPREEHNLASRRPEVVGRLERRLADLVADSSAEAVDDKEPDNVDPETQERLAALGYLGGAKVNVDPSRPLADPKAKIALHNLIQAAERLSREGKLQEAFENVSQALASDQGILKAYFLRGSLFQKMRQPARAEDSFREALARDPLYKAAAFQLAMTYLELGRVEEAASGFGRVLEIDPRDNKSYYLLAKLQIRRKDCTQALALLDQAIESTTDTAPFHNLRAECYIELGELDKAEVEISTALGMKAELPRAHYYLAIIREQRGDIQGAIAAYEDEVRLFPHDHLTFFNLARLYGQAGETGNQMEHLENAIKLKPDFAEGYLQLARAYLDANLPEKAAPLATKGIALKPPRSLASFGHYILAEAHERLGNSEQAEKELAIARSLEGA